VSISVITLGISSSSFPSVWNLVVCLLLFVNCCRLSLYWGSAWGIHLVSSVFFFELVPPARHSDLSLLPYIYSCFWMSRFQYRKGKHKDLIFSNTPGSQFCKRWKYLLHGCHLIFCTSVIWSSNQWSKHRSLIFDRFGYFAFPSYWKLCTSCSRKKSIAAYPSLLGKK
jgi:hypothetical protein